MGTERKEDGTVGEDKGRPRALAPSRSYRLEFTTGADRQFRNLLKDVQERLTPHIDALIRNPPPIWYQETQGG